MSYRLDIIVPVFKEKESFEEFYRAVLSYVHCDWRILVVYDLRDDPTLYVAIPISQKDRRVVPIFNPERGVAGAIKTGIKYTTADAVMITAVDLIEDIMKADTMVGLLYEKEVTIVSPSRYMQGGAREAGTIFQRTLSRLAGVSLYYLAGIPIHDATNGSKLFKKSFLDSINIESTAGWSIALELTVKAHLAKEPMLEIPTIQAKRKFGESKFKIFRWLPSYLRWYIVAIKSRFWL